jgi:hypothetical protein
MKIGNSFSAGMIPLPAKVEFEEIGASAIRASLAGCGSLLGEPITLESVIGHVDTAIIVSGLLGVALPMNRKSVKLDYGESMIIAQYYGPRLPEGATKLPDGAEIRFIMVEVSGRYE